MLTGSTTSTGAEALATTTEAPTATLTSSPSPGTTTEPVTAPVAGSSRSNRCRELACVDPQQTVTQTAPSPNATCEGCAPTRTLSVGLIVAGSTRHRRPSAKLSTQSAPPPYAIDSGPFRAEPTRRARVRDNVVASSRSTVPESQRP